MSPVVVVMLCTLAPPSLGEPSGSPSLRRQLAEELAALLRTSSARQAQGVAAPDPFAQEIVSLQTLLDRPGSRRARQQEAREGVDRAVEAYLTSRSVDPGPAALELARRRCAANVTNACMTMAALRLSGAGAQASPQQAAKDLGRTCSDKNDPAACALLTAAALAAVEAPVAERQGFGTALAPRCEGGDISACAVLHEMGDIERAGSRSRLLGAIVGVGGVLLGLGSLAGIKLSEKLVQADDASSEQQEMQDKVTRIMTFVCVGGAAGAAVVGGGLYLRGVAQRNAAREIAEQALAESTVTAEPRLLLSPWLHADAQQRAQGLRVGLAF